MRLRACGLSDRGRSRERNEDSFVVDPEHRLFVVADGMGGHRHGEVASRIAVETIHRFILEGAGDGAVPGEPLAAPESWLLRAAIRSANERVLGAIRQDGSLLGMGTTVVGLLLDDGRATVAHVGDSRAYRVRDGQLERLTRDHTWVNEQVVAGHLSEEQARHHPLKNVVTRALGAGGEVSIETRELRVRVGERYLLCSDGLSAMLADDEICRELGSDRPLDDICRRLVEAANARGGIDNITVVIVEVGSNGE